MLLICVTLIVDVMNCCTILGAAVRVGITCDEIDQIVHDATIEKGAYPSPLNYHRFPKSVCTSVNEVRWFKLIICGFMSTYPHPLGRIITRLYATVFLI
jgi:hypothetical protein